LFALLAVVLALCQAPRAAAGDAPGWMHAVVNVPLPAHDEKTDAVSLYSEDVLTVQPNGKIKSLSRRAYKILRPGGRNYGTDLENFDSETRITSFHGWCIPTQGKDYEVKEKDALETSLFGVANGELVSDLRTKILRIPASDPGNIVGYEVEHEDRPYVLQDEWVFQEAVPVRETHYTLQLPPGWEYKAVWLNHAEVAPTSQGGNQWQWQLSDIPAVKHEDSMSPWRAVAGELVIRLFPPAGASQGKSFANWHDMGSWYGDLWKNRYEPSPEIKSKVAELTASISTPVEKMRLLARFTQRDIRYVAIELGIGGWQPHSAADVFAHRYGDCKDKSALLATMLREMGIESYHVAINTDRGAVTPDVPPHLGMFDHAILAIRLPEGITDPTLMAVRQHDKLGRLLFFDPTDDLTPFGQLPGYLQSSYGLLVTPDGGELLELPRLPPAMNGVERTAHLALSSSGTLSGNVQEVRLGASAAWQRDALRSASTETDKIKPVETLLASSLAFFRLTEASVGNREQIDKPFIFNYSMVAENYAKTAGNLLLVRPRVIGIESSSLLETKELRKYPVVFEGPQRDTNTYEITLPPGYEVDDLPLPINADYSFASYRSKTEVNGNVLRYTRTFEVKELVVPVKQMDELKKLYRIIAGDERNVAVLKPAGVK
jgi:hypothetical protein